MKTLNAAAPINIPLQRGTRKLKAKRNRFNGFSQLHETVETVSAHAGPSNTPLKRGVNDIATRGFLISGIWAMRSEHITN